MRRRRSKPGERRPKRPSEGLRLAASLLPDLTAEAVTEVSEAELAEAAALLRRLDAET
jgi:hypothetical protein